MFITEKHKNNRSLLSLFLMITFISSQTIKISSGFKTSTKLFINRKRIPSAAYKYNFHSTTSFNRQLHPSSIFLSSVSTDSDYNPSSIMMHQYPIEMSDDERYLFDLNGFLIVRNVLTPDEVKEVNEIIDKHQEEMIQRNDAALRNAVQGTNFYGSGPGRKDLGGVLEWGQESKIFKSILAHPRLVPLFHGILGKGELHN